MTLAEALAWLGDRECVIVFAGGVPRVRPQGGFRPDGPLVESAKREWAEVVAALTAGRDEVIRMCRGSPPDPLRAADCPACGALVVLGGIGTAADVWRLCGRHGRSEWKGRAFVPPCPWKPEGPR